MRDPERVSGEFRRILHDLPYSRVSILRSAHSRQGYPSDLLIWGFQKYGDHLSEKRKTPTATHKLGASKNMGAIFLKKEAPAATYPQVRGFQKYGGHFSEEKKTPAATYPQVRGFQKPGGHFSMCHFKLIFPCGASARVFGSLQSDLSTATLL